MKEKIVSGSKTNDLIRFYTALDHPESGVGRADWRIALACVLIIPGGAVVAAKDLLFARAHREGQAEE